MTAPGSEWMCQRCHKRPVFERGATVCDRCAAEVAEPDAAQTAIETARRYLEMSDKATAFKVKDPALAVALALQGILAVQIELLASQPKDLGDFSFTLPEQGPEPQMGPQPWA